MSSLRLALPAAAWRLPLRRAIQSVAAAGAEGVQFDVRSEVAPNQFGETARRQLRHYLEENDLQVAACTFATQGTLVDPDRLDARVAAIRNVLLFVRQLGANVLTVRAGAIPLESQTTEYERLQTILGDLAAVGNRAGVTVALSSLGNTSSALQALLDSIDDGPVGVDLDPAGCIFAAASPVDALRELHERVAHVQVRDGLRTAEGAGVETAVGAGEVPWDEFLATLAEAEYRGWLTVRRNGGDDVTADLVRGVKYVRNVLPLG